MDKSNYPVSSVILMARWRSGEGTETTDDEHAERINNKAAAATDIPRSDLFLIFDWLLIVDAFDSQAKGSGGDLGLYDFADLLAHQGGADRGFQRNLAGLEVHLVWADYLESHAGICREVREFDTAQKTNPVFWKIVGVNHA